MTGVLLRPVLLPRSVRHDSNESPGVEASRTVRSARRGGGVYRAIAGFW